MSNEQTWQDVANNGIEAAKTLANKIAAIAPDAWEVLVYQQVLSGWVTIFYTVLAWILFACGIKLVMWRLTKENYFTKNGTLDERPTVAFVSAAITVTIFVWAFCITAFSTPKAVMKIANPKYFAAETVVEMISRKND